MHAIPDYAPETAEEIIARHQRMCRELADIALDLTRAAVAAIKREWSRPEAPLPVVTKDQGMLLDRLSRMVRDAIALEARVIAGFGLKGRRAGKPPPDPRRAIIRQVIEEATLGQRDRAGVRRDAFDRLDSELADDPDCNIPVAEILHKVCNELGLTINYGIMTDETLEALIPPDTPPIVIPPGWSPTDPPIPPR